MRTLSRWKAGRAKAEEGPQGFGRRWLSDIACAFSLGGGWFRTLCLLAGLWISEGWQGYVWRFRLVRETTWAKINGVPGKDYAGWCRHYDTLFQTDRRELAADVQTWKRHPRISVLMPVFNPQIDWLEQAIRSVQEQIYPHWELCIADDASTAHGVQALLRRMALQDSRIKLVLREKNGHICAASNSAFDVATGEFIALLDHDDLLAPHALYWVARAALEHPDAGIIYSDEDKIDAHGHRSSPYFKSAFNYDLFLSQNLVSHLGVFRRTLVASVGRFCEGREGSQDYDLALRCMERLQPSQIVHIARVLYHWRVHSNSTSMNMRAKPYAAVAGEAALNAHLQRVGQAGRIRYVGHGYQYLPAARAQDSRVSIIVCIESDMHDLHSVAARLRTSSRQADRDMFWVASPTLSTECVRRLEQQASQMGVRWFGARHGDSMGARVNAAAATADTEMLVLLRGGIRPRHPEWLPRLIAHAARSRVGVTGVRLTDRTGMLIHGGMFMRGSCDLISAHYGLSPQFKGYFGRAVLNQSFHAVSAACIAVRRTLFDSVNGLDGEWTTLRFAVADLCLRLNEQGQRTLWTPDVEMRLGAGRHDEAWHLGAQTANERRDADRWSRRWSEKLGEDLYYNPNLSWEHSHFELAWPPRSQASALFRTAPYHLSPWVATP
ncbi:glycosyltransferase [Diaphorobacter sp. HDW4B]|uniref:glycosyltransferase family 2 protein n=1 Tax=Diaphorobacter sp. HDW4B TaxID=2714925 RepID=UPI001F0D55AA|nr:glycosyltransferase [Diaphorobacter sp. HDW4B]